MTELTRSYFVASMKQRPKYLVSGIDTQEFYDSAVAGLSAETLREIADEVLSFIRRKGCMTSEKDGGLTTTGVWDSIEILRNGRQVLSDLEHLPLVNDFCLQLCRKLGYGSAFLSVIKEGARITPHYGLRNAKLRCHLQVSGGNGMLFVGRDQRETMNGRLIVFDDSIIHWVTYSPSFPGARVCVVWDIPHPHATAVHEAEVRRRASANQAE